MVYDNEFLTDINDNIKLIQKKQGLHFGTDALLLAAFIKSNPNNFAYDLGSGSGIISLLCAARKKFKKITAVEIQSDYALLIKRNAEYNGYENIVYEMNCDVKDIIKNKSLNATASAVFTNPPYLKINSGIYNETESENIARRELKGDINDFCSAADMLLNWNSSFYIVYRPERLVDLFFALRKNHLEPKRLCFIHSDENHPPCLILAEAKKGGNPDLKILKPLMLKYNGEVSKEAQIIYETGNWYE